MSIRQQLIDTPNKKISEGQQQVSKKGVSFQYFN